MKRSLSVKWTCQKDLGDMNRFTPTVQYENLAMSIYSSQIHIAECEATIDRPKSFLCDVKEGLILPSHRLNLVC